MESTTRDTEHPFRGKVDMGKVGIAECYRYL